MKKEVKVSIIVPVYNASKHLQATLDALLSQTLKEIQIILVNDGSIDESGEICDYYAERDERITCIHKKNGGVSAARNDGIRVAEGEFLMFCDADDIPNKKQAELLYEKAIKERADIVLCGFVKEQGGKKIEERFPYKDTLTTKMDILENLIMPMCVWGYAPQGKKKPNIYGSTWRGIYKKELCIKDDILIGFPEEIKLGEDMIFNAKCWWKAKRIAFIQKALYFYVENQNSATHSNAELMWKKYQVTWEKMYEILEDIGCGEKYLQWQQYQLTRYATSAIIESVCTQKVSWLKKVKLIRTILNNEKLKLARRFIPDDLGKKEKVIVWILRPIMAIPILLYYQNI